jgi:hypothetical protein
MFKQPRLIRRSTDDIRKFILSNWMPLLNELLPSQHYPIILNKYYKQADENVFLEKHNHKKVNKDYPNYRLYYGLKHWDFLAKPPKANAPDWEQERYEKQPTIKRHLSTVLLGIEDMNWDKIAIEIYESFRRGQKQKLTNNELYLEQMLVIQPEKAFFLVRNPYDEGEFIVLDLWEGPYSQPELYETNTAYTSMVGGIAEMTFFGARNWSARYRRDVMGLLNEPASTPAQIEQRIRRDLNHSFNSHYSDQFHALLKFAISKIEHLGGALAIAASPCRYNDAMSDDNWMAIRIDGYAWTNGAYFEGNSLQALNAMSDTARVLLGILTQLIAADFRRVLTESYGIELDPNCVWCLAKEDEKWTFAFSDSNGHDGASYHVDPRTGALTFIGLATRFDWNFLDLTRTDSDKNILDIITIEDWIISLKSGDFTWEKGDPHIHYKDLIFDNAK